MGGAGSCPAYKCFTRACLHHLLKEKEVLSLMLLSWHNLHYYRDLMVDTRLAIEVGSFADYEANFHAMQAMGDVEQL